MHPSPPARQVHLAPAALRLEPPTAAQFHADLAQLFDAGVRSPLT